MRAIGIVLVIVGGVMGLYAFTMDVSLRAPNGAMIYNMELAGERLLIAIFGCAGFISGVLLVGFGEVVCSILKRGTNSADTKDGADVPFFYRYDPQFLGGVGLIIFAALVAVGWLFARQ